MTLGEYRMEITGAITESIRKDGALDGDFQGYNMDRSDSQNTNWSDSNFNVLVDGVLPD
jgi:hypothetical protein